jgi:hypothetical protein
MIKDEERVMSMQVVVSFVDIFTTKARI